MKRISNNSKSLSRKENILSGLRQKLDTDLLTLMIKLTCVMNFVIQKNTFFFYKDQRAGYGKEVIHIQHTSIALTRRYGPLRRPSSSSVGGLWPRNCLPFE